MKNKQLTFDTWEEAQEYFYKYNDCMSDDVDSEEYRLMDWAEGNDIIVREDEPRSKIKWDRSLIIALVALVAVIAVVIHYHL